MNKLASVAYGYSPSMNNNKLRTVSNAEQSRLSITLNEVKKQLRFFASFSFERSLICTKMADLLDNYGYFLEWMDEHESAARNLINQCLTMGYVSNTYFGYSTPEQLAKISKPSLFICYIFIVYFILIFDL